MKYNHIFGVLMLVTLLGAGCAGGSTGGTVVENDLDTNAFFLPIANEDVVPEPTANGWRIEEDGFVAIIESGYTESEFASTYPDSQAGELGLGDSAVTVADGGAEDKRVYFHANSGTLITVIGDQEEAEGFLSAIYWN